MEKVKAFCDNIEKGHYDVIANFFADPKETTEEGREEAKKILSQVKTLSTVKQRVRLVEKTDSAIQPFWMAL